MAKYIDAEKLKSAIRFEMMNLTRAQQKGCLYAIQAVDCAPTADVQKVKHGEWLENGAPDNCPLKEAIYYDGRRFKSLREHYCIEITKRLNAQRLQLILSQLKKYISAHQHRGDAQDQRMEEYWNGAYWAIAQIEINLTKELSHGRE